VVTGAGPVYSELDTQERGLLGQQAAAGVLGITATDSIRDALRTVQNPVVLEGLLNNQHAPAGIPKGTSPNESFHSFLDSCLRTSTVSMDLFEIIIGLLFITFNSSKARATHLGCRLDHDYLLATLSTTSSNLLQTALNTPRLFLLLDRVPMPARRTFADLTSAGYAVKPKIRDPFTTEQLASVTGALKRLAADPHCMGSYRNPVTWIAQSVLGNARPVPHVRALLDHATVVDGALVQAASVHRRRGARTTQRGSGSVPSDADSLDEGGSTKSDSESDHESCLDCSDSAESNSDVSTSDH